jgi:succinyl-CoA synthetase beta subunit
VSKLYFQQKQHNKLVKHIYTSFGLFVRERYYINILLKEDDLIIRLSEKSGIDLEKIHSILSKLSNPNAITTESQLVELYKELNYFYENCN